MTNKRWDQSERENEEVLALARQYWRLMQQDTLNPAESTALQAILDLVLYDDPLEHWVSLMDGLLYPDETATYSMAQFVQRVKELGNLRQELPKSNALPILRQCAEALLDKTQILKLVDCFVADHGSPAYEHEENFIYSAPCRLFAIRWQPGNKSTAHHHGADLSLIYVVSGTLSQGIAPLAGADLEWASYGPGSWISIPVGYVHKLVNRSPEPVIGLHFKTGHSDDVLFETLDTIPDEIPNLVSSC
jgi:uncharacterized RmlC-like cupin family protein